MNTPRSAASKRYSIQWRTLLHRWATCRSRGTCIRILCWRTEESYWLQVAPMRSFWARRKFLIPRTIPLRWLAHCHTQERAKRRRYCRITTGCWLQAARAQPAILLPLKSTIHRQGSFAQPVQWSADVRSTQRHYWAMALCSWLAAERAQRLSEPLRFSIRWLKPLPLRAC